MPHARHLTGHVPRLEGQIHAIWEAGTENLARVHLEAHAGTERTQGALSRNAQAGACMAQRVCQVPRRRGGADQSVCRLQRRQDTLGLLDMFPQTSLPAMRRMGINEERNHSEKNAKNGTKTREPDQCHVDLIVLKYAQILIPKINHSPNNHPRGA